MSSFARHIPLTPLRTGGPGRLVWLYARSRGVLASFALVMGVCAGFALLREWAGVSAVRQASVLHTLPALAASVIGVSAWSPFGEPERTVSGRLVALRGLHVGLLLAAAVAVSGIGLATWPALAPGFDPAAVTLRNLLGLTGIALALGRVVDARLSWLGPVAVAAIAAARLLVATPETLWSPPWWAWTGQEPGNVSSWAMAGAFGVAGLVAFVLHGARDVAGDDA